MSEVCDRLSEGRCLVLKPGLVFQNKNFRVNKERLKSRIEIKIENYKRRDKI